jgi:hypothetical protein
VGGGATTPTEAIGVVMRGPALMAQNHKLQDTPSSARAKAPKREQSREALQLIAAKGPGALPLAALGLNAWLTGVGWFLLSTDVWFDGEQSAPAWRGVLLAMLSLLPLAIGVPLAARATGERWHKVACWLLLCVFPAGLAAALCMGNEESRERAHGAWSMLLAGLSLLAYGVAALQTCRAPLPILPARSHARRSERTPSPEPTQGARDLAAAIILCGALAIALIAPLSGSFTQLTAAWGEAADAGAALTAVVAGAIAVSLVSLDLGPLLKGQSLPRRSTRRQRNRIATMLFLTLLGGAVYLTVTP